MSKLKRYAIAAILLFLGFSSLKNVYEQITTDPYPEQTRSIQEQQEGLRKLRESYKEVDKIHKELTQK